MSTHHRFAARSSHVVLLMMVATFLAWVPKVAVSPAAAASGATCGTTGVLLGTSCTYNVTGTDVFNPPSGVAAATFTVVGADSGTTSNLSVTTSAQPGGEAIGTLALTPGAAVQVDVAGLGGSASPTSPTGGMNNGVSGGHGGAGGFGGSNQGVPGGPGDASGGNGGTNAFNGGNGSGGGGSSDVRMDPAGCGSLTCPLTDRVVVAGGGGGNGGNGGNGGAQGGTGGAGGGTVGGDGSLSVTGGNHGSSGFGGTQSAGGAGGHNTFSPPTNEDGVTGTFGAGGAGGNGNGGGGAGGGGAGGGWYGGGAGSGGGGTTGASGGGGAGGGGGGGSGFVTAAASNASLIAGANGGSVNGGNGEVVVSWAAPAGPAATSLTLSTSQGSATVGQSVTLTAVVAPAPDGGTVQFGIDGANAGAPVALSAGRALLATSFAAGTHSVTATYSGDAAFGPSTGSLAGGEVFSEPPFSIRVAAGPQSMTPTSGTSTNATVSCPTGMTLVGGGIQQFRSADAGQPGNPTGDGTGWETQGLKTNGSIPSDANGTPVVTGTANTSFWTAVGGFGGVGETGDNVTGFGMCASGGSITPPSGPSTVVAVNTVASSSVTTPESPLTTSCPSGTELVGGGMLAIPATVGNLKPIASFPSDAAGHAAIAGTSDPNSWTMVVGIMGNLNNPSYSWSVYAMCSYDTALHTQVATGDILNFAPPTSTTIGPTAEFPVTASCPANMSPLDGGTQYLVNGAYPAQGDGYYGFHIIGDYPSDAAGHPALDGTTNPTSWTGVIHTGGIAIASVDLHAYALCTAVTAAAPSSDLSVSASAPASALAGSPVTATLTVTNGGPSSATGATVTDTVTGAAPGSVATTQGSCSTSGATVTCNLGPLAAGASATVTVTATPNAPGTVTSAASVSADQADANLANNTASASTAVTASPTADLVVTKSAPATALVGAPVTSTVTVANQGPAPATGVAVTDTVSGGTPSSVSTTQGSCVTASQTISCTLGGVGVGSPVIVTVVASAPAAGALADTATASANETDPNAANTTASATTTVSAASADLAVTNTGPAVGAVGAPVTYTVATANNGPNPATGATVTDTLGSGITFASAVSTQGSCSASGSVVTCALGNLAVSATATATIVGTPTVTGTVTSTAVVTADQPDPNTANNASSAALSVSAPGGSNAFIYAGNCTKNTITAYPQGANGNVTPTVTIAGANTGLSCPLYDYVDPSGGLYVVNSSNSSVTEYAPGANGNVAPVDTIAGPATGLAHPTGLAVDRDGDVYVLNSQGGPSITEYAPGANGNAAPIKTISGSNTGMTGFAPGGLALDPSGDLFVGRGSTILEYGPGANGNASPIATISGSSTQLNCGCDLVTDAAGNLYVTSLNNNNVFLVFAAGSNGNVAPARTISGSNTGIQSPEGVGLDSGGDIFVANATTITEYAAGASGNVTPLTTIGGASTGLQPTAVAILPAEPAPSAPPAPSGVQALTGAASAYVTFNPPPTDNGGLISSYLVTAIDATTPANGGQTATGPASPVVVTGLTNGDSYTFTVAATNGAGTGPASSPSSAVVPDATASPTAPLNVQAIGAGSGTAVVTFSAPIWNGGSAVTSYRVLATDGTHPANGGQVVTATAVSPVTFTGLTNGDTYTFTVAASNAVAAGPDSAPSNPVTPNVSSLYVANMGANSILEFAQGASGDALPVASVSGSNSQLGGPNIVALDKNATLYVADLNTNAVTEYAPGANGNVTPTVTISGSSTGFNSPRGVGVDNAGNVYVSNNNAQSVSVFPPGASGNVTPTATIVGSKTLINRPWSVVVDSGGDIFVASASGNAILGFPKGANGNVAPSVNISGAATGLNGPEGLALDAAGNLYVANSNNNTVSVFPAGSNGNVTPTATIAGADTGLSVPAGVAVDAAGTIYVGNLLSNAITEYPAGSNGDVTPTVTIAGTDTALSRPEGLALPPLTPAPATPPSAPSAVSALPGNASAFITFGLPASNGGALVTSYVVTATDTTNPARGGQVVTGTGSPLTVGGLANGDSYTFAVSAVNAIGTGAAATTNAVVASASAPPGAPVIGQALPAGSQAASVAFSPPAWNGGSTITAYTVVATDTTNAAHGGQTVTGTASPLRVAGLTNGDSYTFTVAAANAVATGPASAASNPVVPSAPVLYVANTTTNSVTEYGLGANGNVVPAATLQGAATGLSGPNGLAVDAAGNLWVANQSASTITEYAPGAAGNTAPIATLSGPATTLGTPTDVAFDAAGHLWVANSASVTEYPVGASGNTAPIATLAGASTLLLRPSALAFDAAGNLYVANTQQGGSPNANSITEYPPGANGNVAPLARIQGASTAISFPRGLTVSSDGTVYVANQSSSAVVGFPAGSNGNVTPTVTVAGAATGLAAPWGLAIDGSGHLVVANQTNSSITEYSAGANGNAAPVATIAGADTGLTNPEGVFIVPSPATIVGTVTDASSHAPLGGVCVYLYAHGGARTADPGTCTNASGGYVLPVANPGSYDVAFLDPTGAHATQWYNAAATQASATAVTTTAGGVTMGINAAMAPISSGLITGTVTDATTHAGVANICVYLYTTAGNRTADPGTCTDANGSYAMAVASPGSYDVAFADPSGHYATQWYNGAPTTATATPVTVTAGATTPDVNAALSAPALISGTVTDTATGSPLPNICVYLYTTTGARTSDVGTCTDANGRYAMAVASPGSYDVAFADPSGHYATQWYNGAPTTATATPVTVAAGATTPNVNAALSAPALITGTVTDTATGSPVANICVYLYTTTGARTADVGTCTDANGRYAMAVASAGSYDVAFADPSGHFSTQWFNGAPTTATATPVTVSAGATTPNVNAALSAPALITGTVTDAGTGAGLANICVYLYSSTGHRTADPGTCTDANGNYAMAVAAPGSYQVAFFDPSGNHLTGWYDNQTAESSASLVAVTAATTTPAIDEAMQP